MHKDHKIKPDPSYYFFNRTINIVCRKNIFISLFLGLIQYSQVYVSSPYIKNLNTWKELGANVSTDNSVVAKEADIIFLAVKPHILQEAVEQIKASPLATKIKNKLFVSILAGITIKDLEEVKKNNYIVHVLLSKL